MQGHDHQGGQNQCDKVPVDDGADEFLECILKAHVTLFYICARAYVSLDICAYWAKVANKNRKRSKVPPTSFSVLIFFSLLAVSLVRYGEFLAPFGAT